MMQNQDSRISHTSANGILTVRVKGRVALDLLTKYITQYSEVWVRHACILWDTLELDLSGVTADEVLQLPDSSKAITKLKAGRRTAVLARKEFALIAKFIYRGVYPSPRIAARITRSACVWRTPFRCRTVPGIERALHSRTDARSG